MRYWIWWNDIIQGPFELDELTSLRAFSDDLLVCMEDREDWVPASRVADLSSAIEQLRERKAAPLTPPPPPPKRPPAVTPLQGEFFREPPGQQPLLESEDEPKGPYAYCPVTGFDGPGGGPGSNIVGQFTSPFHFKVPPQGNTAVIEIPRPASRATPMPAPAQAPTPVPAPMPTPTPIPKPARIAFTPPPVIKESPVSKPEQRPPAPEEKKPEPKPIIPLRLLRHDEPAPPVPPPPVVRNISSSVAAAPPSVAPSLTEPPAETWRNLKWLPWSLGMLVSIGILISVGYWVMDRFSSRSAIVEAQRMDPPPVPPADSPGPIPEPVAPSKKVPRVKRALRSIAALKDPKKIKSQAPRPVAKPPVETSKPTPVPEPIPDPVPAPLPIPAVDTPPPAPKAAAPDPWRDRQTDAINSVMAKPIPGSKVTIGNQARTMIQTMREKEMLHAAETGERLYLPDKMSWSALQEEGPNYRVYLNFLSWKASGERVQSRSYQFLVDMERKMIRTEDTATQQDLFTPPAESSSKHNAMAVDIESILGGVDHYNKQKMRAMIVKNNRRNKDEQKNIATSLAAAKEKVQRAIVYFRRAYSDKALLNISKAYEFSDLLKE